MPPMWTEEIEQKKRDDAQGGVGSGNPRDGQIGVCPCLVTRCAYARRRARRFCSASRPRHIDSMYFVSIDTKLQPGVDKLVQDGKIKNDVVQRTDISILRPTALNSDASTCKNRQASYWTWKSSGDGSIDSLCNSRHSVSASAIIQNAQVCRIRMKPPPMFPA